MSHSTTIYKGYARHAILHSAGRVLIRVGQRSSPSKGTLSGRDLLHIFIAPNVSVVRTFQAGWSLSAPRSRYPSGRPCFSEYLKVVIECEYSFTAAMGLFGKSKRNCASLVCITTQIQIACAITVAPNVSVARKCCSSHTVPIYDSSALHHAILRSAGRNLTVGGFESSFSTFTCAFRSTEHSPIQISLNTCLPELATKVKFRCCDSILVAFVITWMHRQTLSLQLNASCSLGGFSRSYWLV